MFKNLTNFKYVRNPKEAVGFYIVYLVVMILIAITQAPIIVYLTNHQYDRDFNSAYGSLVGIVVVVILSVLILKSKKILNNWQNLLLVLIAGILALFGGAFGLIITAYLTTRKK